MAKTWQINDPIAPEDMNRLEVGAEKASGAIQGADFTRAPGTATTGGTSSALTAIIPGFVRSDLAMAVIKLHVDIANNATLNISGTGAAPLYSATGQAVEANAKAGAILSVCYNATNNRYYITGGSGGGSVPAGTTQGTATALTVMPNASFQLVDMAMINIKLHTDIGNAAVIDVGGTGPRGIYTTTGHTVLAGAAVAGSVITLVYNQSNTRFYAIGLSEITAHTVIDTDIRRERWTGDGVKTKFDFVNGSYIVGDNRLLYVNVGAVPQLLGDSYTESSTTSITFAQAPPAGAIIDVLYAYTLFGDGVDFGSWN